MNEGYMRELASYKDYNTTKLIIERYLERGFDVEITPNNYFDENDELKVHEEVKEVTQLVNELRETFQNESISLNIEVNNGFTTKGLWLGAFRILKNPNLEFIILREFDQKLWEYGFGINLVMRENNK